MNVLLVYAHPEPASFNGALKDLAVEVLTGAGHSVEVSDLYAMRFDPVTGPGDFLRPPSISSQEHVLEHHCLKPPSGGAAT
jgi:NAD(P)H dehydrogenase (quinone)